MPNPSQFDVIKPEVRGLSAYTLKHFDADVKLDQNENPYELPPDLKREVMERVLRRPWGRYPEFVPAAIIHTLAKFTGWHEDGILVGNGSNELIQASLMVTLGPGRRLAVPQPTFTLYKLMATTLQAQMDEVFLDAEHPNLVVLRTFSKAMAMAGLRFGYMMAHPEIAREVHKSKLPYNVNIFTLTAAELVIERRAALNQGIAALIRERDRIFGELQKRPAVRAFPSKANFVLI